MTKGSISFPDKGTGRDFQPISFTVPVSTLTKFNKDFKVQLFQVRNNAVYNVGLINETTVTILFNDLNPPAGSVDEFYNADFNSLLAVYAANVPITVPPNNPNPGVGLYGQVYGLNILSNNEAVVVGDFQSYNGQSQNNIAQACIALVNTNGQWDASFNAGSGADGAINAVAVAGSQFYIGGNFNSFNGSLDTRIARLNADASLDTTFNPGSGADGTVRALQVLTNGEVLIAGDFTHVNGTACNYIALLETDGALDTSFNPDSTISGPVYALTLYYGLGTEQVVAGGSFSVPGQSYANIVRLNRDGSVDASFNPGTGADAPVHALAAQMEGQILVGGEFSHFNGKSYGGIARLNSSGSLDTTNFFIGTGADATVFCIAPMLAATSTNYTYDVTGTNVTGTITPMRPAGFTSAVPSLRLTARTGWDLPASIRMATWTRRSWIRPTTSLPA